MNLNQYYPGIPITYIENQDNLIIIHTELDVEKETYTIHDLPMFGTPVVIKISSTTPYNWIAENGNTKRLNQFIYSCCETIPDGNIFEDILSLDNILCSPSDPIDILFSDIPDYKKASTPCNIRKESGRGAKSKVNYRKLRAAIKDILTNGLSYEHNESFEYLPLILSTDKESENVKFDPSYREILSYLRENIKGMENLSLQTLHQTMEKYFPDFSLQSKNPKNYEDYAKGSNDFSQLYFDLNNAVYQSEDKEYQRIQLKPAKINIESNSYEEILKEIKEREILSASVSKDIFMDKYHSWIANLAFFCHYTPGIQIENGNLYLLYMYFSTEDGQFRPVEKIEMKCTSLQTKKERTTTEIKCLYYGKYTYGKHEYKSYGALSQMRFPDADEIEIGIGDCIRFSAGNTNYLIPLLTIKKYIV